MKCYTLVNHRAGRHDLAGVTSREFGLCAASLDDKCGCSPNLEADRGTTWGQVLQAERNLRQLVNQRFAVVGHAQRPQVSLEAPSAQIGAGEVAISNNRQPAYARIDETGEVEAWGDPATIAELHYLAASETKLEVGREHFLCSLGMTINRSRLCTAFAQEAVKISSSKCAG